MCVSLFVIFETGDLNSCQPMQCFAIVRPIIIRPSLFGRIYPRCHIHRLRPLDLDVRQELVDYLVSKEFSESQAKGLIDTLDASILEALTNRSRNLITTQEYLTVHFIKAFF